MIFNLCASTLWSLLPPSSTQRRKNQLITSVWVCVCHVRRTPHNFRNITANLTEAAVQERKSGNISGYRTLRSVNFIQCQLMQARENAFGIWMHVQIVSGGLCSAECRYKSFEVSVLQSHERRQRQPCIFTFRLLSAHVGRSRETLLQNYSNRNERNEI